MPFPLCPVCFNDGGDVSKQKVFEDTRSVARGGGKDGNVVVGNISPRSGHQVILFALTDDFSQPARLLVFEPGGLTPSSVKTRTIVAYNNDIPGR